LGVSRASRGGLFRSVSALILDLVAVEAIVVIVAITKPGLG
jgi:hypothetical protein